MKCPHLLKIDTAYKLYASDTTEMLAKIVKEKKKIHAEELNSLHL